MKKELIATITILSCLTACDSKKQQAAAPEAPVHNAFTDSVDRGHSTMNQADQNVKAMNAIDKSREQQAQAVDAQ